MAEYRGPRYYTNKLLEMMEEGLVYPYDVVSLALSYMSEADVEDMMRVNELLGEEEDEDEEEEEDEDENEDDEA